MCMLTYLPAGVMPDAEALTNGAEYNQDGHGFAIVSGSRILVRKSMDSEYLIATFERMRRSHPDGPALFHSRYGTGGTVNKYNCHPFRVGHDKRTVVAHNGVLGQSVQPRGLDKRCDTHIAADHVFGKAFGHLSQEQARMALERWIGWNNKLVFLTVDPSYARQSYIINERAGVWNEGVWYSNTDFQRYNRWNTTKHWWQDEAARQCPYCLESGAGITRWDTCKTCGTCLECLDYEADCQCFVPGATVSNSTATPRTATLYVNSDGTLTEEGKAMLKRWSDWSADLDDGATER